MQSYRKNVTTGTKLLNGVGEGVTKYTGAFGCVVGRYRLQGDNIEAQN